MMRELIAWEGRLWLGTCLTDLFSASGRNSFKRRGEWTALLAEAAASADRLLVAGVLHVTTRQLHSPPHVGGRPLQPTGMAVRHAEVGAIHVVVEPHVALPGVQMAFRSADGPALAVEQVARLPAVAEHDRIGRLLYLALRVAAGRRPFGVVGGVMARQAPLVRAIPVAIHGIGALRV